MEKVKITEKEARNIEKLLSVLGSNERCVKQRARHNFNDYYEPINKMDLDKFIRALYIGYEVEPEFKENDWIYISEEGANNFGEMVAKIESIFNESQLSLDNAWNISANSQHIRRAALSEIAAEKERRWWSKHGRDVWELRKGDILTRNDDGFLWMVDGKRDVLPGYYLNGESFNLNDIRDRYQVACFTENRLDVSE